MSSTSSKIILASVLRVVQPLARLLIRNGVTYPAFAQALKRVFLDAAQQELASKQMATTDSAVSLLSGVHRRDVRNLTRLASESDEEQREPLSMVSQIVARWLADPLYLDPISHRPKVLPRKTNEDGFDGLVASISSDVRPRAVLDEMHRLGVIDESENGIRLLTRGFAPRKGMEEKSMLFSDNLHDHVAAASLNLHADADFLEQAVFVDQITADSSKRLSAVAKQAWQDAYKPVLREAQIRFDEDAAQAKPEERSYRARFGVYFYYEEEDKS